MQEISVDDAVELAAIDSEFYKHHFFPKAFRQTSPPCHRELWVALEEPSNRYVAAKLPRDWAKTTNLRGYASKRIAYGISRTIVLVGISEDAAIKTLSWLKNNVEYNKQWTGTYGLEKGKKWAESHIEIKHNVLSAAEEAAGRPPVVITVIAIGITGSTRGINIDDFRPDLILVDDPCDEENTHTPEQREKTENRFFGALYNSLAPESEAPEAKMVLLQTPLDTDDLISQCMDDDNWVTVSISVFTEDGKNSTWPERYPFEVLQREKQSYISKNRLHIWMREKEVTVISSELSQFRQDWLSYWDMPPEGGINFIGIDPTPPPKANAKTVSSGKAKKLDDAVILVVKLYKRKVYLLDYYCTKSPSTQELVNKFFEFCARYRPMKIGVETHLFQRVLKERIDLEMQRRLEFYTVEGIEDKRPKPVRIEQTISDYASNRAIVVHKTHTKFITQFASYPNVSHDDVLDAFAIALSFATPAMMQLANSYIEGEYSVVDDDDETRLLENWRIAP